MIWLVLLFAVLLFAIALFRLIALISGAPLISLNNKVADKALELIRLERGQTFIDLGCGWGNVLNIAQKKYSADVVGVEISPLPYLISSLRFRGVHWQNIFSTNIEKYDVVFAYLFPGIVHKLSPKLIKYIQGGGRMVSVSFPITGLKAKTITKFRNHTIYTYSS